ncbi:hypothetical protein RN001_003828 [Aquatica leii]|uniref:Uncharacterized protein n=1 Tax=Aquatica leii TaxID=1421715 RepID=A0AAN7Q9X1_9COLE|nr:hypothetical protein RN001_003828 [Aquatica leii]
MSFLETTVSSKSSDQTRVMNKRNAIGQAIVAACRLRTFISAIPMDVGIYIHRHYGSRQLVDFLNRLGFCTNYNEIQRYENYSSEILLLFCINVLYSAM